MRVCLGEFRDGEADDNIQLKVWDENDKVVGTVWIGQTGVRCSGGSTKNFVEHRCDDLNR